MFVVYNKRTLPGNGTKFSSKRKVTLTGGYTVKLKSHFCSLLAIPIYTMIQSQAIDFPSAVYYS